MSKRVSVNVWVENEDGTLAQEDVVMTQKQLFAYVNDPSRFPEDLAPQAQGWTYLNWQFKPGTNDLDHILFRADVEITPEREAFVKDLFVRNPEFLNVLKVRKYRGYRNLKASQKEVQNLIGNMAVEPDEAERVVMATQIWSILEGMGFSAGEEKTEE